MEATTIQRYMHTTPRKLRLVADMVRSMEPNKAVETLRFTNKAAAVDLGKAIKTALANAKNKGMEESIIKALEINEGSKMKRFMAGTRGRAKPYARRMAHIKVVLTDEIVNVKNDKMQVTSNKKETVVIENVIPSVVEESVEEKQIATKPAKNSEVQRTSSPRNDKTQKARPAKKVSK